jgi:uncharacterized protein YneF (UPF0154 family)
MSGDCFNITRQISPGEFEVDAQHSSLILHYSSQVDVLAVPHYDLVASRTKQKQIQIAFTGLTGSSDLEEVADSLLGQSELLPASRRAPLLKALSDLRSDIGRARPQISLLSDPHPRSVKSKKLEKADIRNGGAPQLAVTLSKAEVDNILHSALEKIHWGDDSACLKTLQELVEISQYDRNLSLVIQHEPLINTLVNKLKTFATSNLPACICIVAVFEKMSYFANYQTEIARLKIGAMCLSLLHAQVRLASVAAQSLAGPAKSAYLQTQNQLLKLIVSLLFNIAEGPSAMRKMVNKDIISPLTSVLKRTSGELVALALRFLRKVANVPVNWPDVTYEPITEAIGAKVLAWRLDDPQTRARALAVIREAIELLYTFSFHAETIAEFKKFKIFAMLASFTAVPELRMPMIKFFYKCSTLENLDEYFRDSDLLKMLITASASAAEDRLLALIVLGKLSVDKECAKTIATSPSFTSDNVRSMFVQATQRQSPENRLILKMLRNIADAQPTLVDGLDQDIITAVVRNSQNLDGLSDIISIANRSKMNSARAKTFATHKEFVTVLAGCLSNQRAPPQLQLEGVMFVAAVVLYSDAAKALGAWVVGCVVTIFLGNPDDADIQAQCMFAFYRFICHAESRSALVANRGIVNAVIRHSASRNSVLAGMGNAVLEALVSFDKEWSEKIRRPRYESFNQEWIKSMRVAL